MMKLAKSTLRENRTNDSLTNKLQGKDSMSSNLRAGSLHQQRDSRDTIIDTMNGFFIGLIWTNKLKKKSPLFSSSYLMIFQIWGINSLSSRKLIFIHVMGFNFFWVENIFYFKICAFIYSKLTCPTSNKNISSLNMSVNQPLSHLLLELIQKQWREKNKQTKGQNIHFGPN